MEPFPDAFAQTISTSVSHVVRTTVVRNDLIGWVMSGHKRLVGPTGEMKINSGRIFILPRLTEWDYINEAKPGGRYEARVIGFSPLLVEEFHEQFGQFSAVPAVQGCASSTADEEFATTFTHAFAALADNVTTNAISKHRALEVLLMLAERGFVFAASKELGWAERVRRLIGQRPHANWTLDEVASAFHQSGSTLQRRLASESASFTRCLREVRLETAMALLQDKRLQVAEVAARCGYDSHSRFSAAFRKRYGYTPSHLRP
jgi:AraC-like DNA-binding protein